MNTYRWTTRIALAGIGFLAGNRRIRRRNTHPQRTARRHPARGIRAHRHDDSPLHDRSRSRLHNDHHHRRKPTPPQTPRQCLTAHEGGRHYSTQGAGL